MSKGRSGRYVPPLLVIACLGLAACVSPPPSAAPPTTRATTTSTTQLTQGLLAEARTFVFRVRSVACLVTGTSFAVSGGIATNRHVASGATTLALATWDGVDFTVKVRAISQVDDLALLSAAPNAPAAVFASNDPAPGAKVWVAGYPLGDQLSLLAGHVLGYVSGSPFDEPGQIIEISNAIQPGNSGSPLLDSKGQVVGIVFAIDTQNNDGLAIPLSTLQEFLIAPGTVTLGGCVG